jgi:hypothetical protein
MLITVAAIAICMPFLGLSRTFLGLVARFVASIGSALFASDNGDLRRQPLCPRSFGQQ